MPRQYGLVMKGPLTKKEIQECYQIVAAINLMGGMMGNDAEFAKSLIGADTDFYRLMSTTRDRMKDDSIQKKIIDLYEGTENGTIVWKEFEKARQTAGAIFVKLLFGSSLLKKSAQLLACTSDSPRLRTEFFDAIFWRYVSIQKGNPLNLPVIRASITKKLESGDGKFFVKLGAELANTKSLRGLVFNSILFKMAEYWVNPDAPLWMMNNEAGSVFVGQLLRENVSAENYAKLIVRYNFVRFGTFPINQTKIDRSGNFTGFGFSKWVPLKG